MLSEVDLTGYQKISAMNIPTEKFISSGHRACQGCGEALAMGMVMKVAGKNTIVVNATGCMEIVTSSFPQTAWLTPWIHVAFENAAAVGSGICVALDVLERHGKLNSKKPKVIIFGGDGATADIGIGSLSGALERGHDFVYVCLDNEAYMNTGVQRSSSTPYGATTTTSPNSLYSIGQTTWKKNMPAIAIAHRVPYVATASPAFHLDLMNKVHKAFCINGPAYLHLYAVCPTGWGIKSEQGIKLARLAVNSLMFPLYEVVGGRYTISKRISKPVPVLEYLKLQRRFRHLTEVDAAYIQERVSLEYAWLQTMEVATSPKTK
ncbi:Pyruvate synthase subunit PorB [Desulfovibrionales bacterium]